MYICIYIGDIYSCQHYVTSLTLKTILKDILPTDETDFCPWDKI